MLYRKNPKADLKRNYTIYLQVGLILTLLIVITAVKLDLQTKPPEPPSLDEQEVVEMEDVIQTKQVETPPPPPRPPVPVEVPNDEVIEDEILDLDAELDLDGPMDLPPPPAPDEEEGDEIFVVVEQYPEPIGGIAAIHDKIDYPDMARRAGIEGKVYVEFVVTEEGNVEEPKIVRGIHPLCDKEAVEAIRKTKFRPGKQRGRPVSVRFTMGITFRLQN